MAATTALHDELLAYTRAMLDAIDSRDAAAYRAMTAPDVTCFEPEAKGQRLDGLPFHEFFVATPRAEGVCVRSEIAGFHIRELGPSAAVVSFTRITQNRTPDGAFHFTHVNETRVLERRAGGWMQTHIHRSAY